MNWKDIFFCFAVVAFCLLGSSCIRTSTVVKVRKEGSGEIISRYYFSPQLLAMVEHVEALGVNAGGAGAQFGMIREIVTPREESLKVDAKNFGEGVSYVKHESGKDSEGWKGYTVAYAFEDVRTVRIDQNSIPGKAKEYVEASGQQFEAENGGHLTFDLEGDLLTIRSTLAEGNMDELLDEEQLKRANQIGMKPVEAIQMAAASTKGMRAGFFVRIDGEIAETDAEHATGNLIILSDAEVSKILQDPDFVNFVSRATENPSAVTRESVKELFRDIEAMTIELSEEVSVRFQ